jgi:hypothetical protein
VPGVRWFILRTAVCVTLGMATTVGVAWGIAAGTPSKFQSPRYLLNEIRPECVEVRLEYRHSAQAWRLSRTEGRRSTDDPRRAELLRDCFGDIFLLGGWHPTSTLAGAAPFPPWGTARPEPGKMLDSVQRAAGWPFLALSCECPGWGIFGGEVTTSRGFISLTRGATARADGYGAFLPLLPIWSGFLADTAIFAGAWAGIIFAPGVRRRIIRRPRTGCPHCGYDLSAMAHPVCPECGAPCDNPEITLAPDCR